MFDCDRDDFVEFFQQFKGSVSVHDVVEGQLFALELASVGNARLVELRLTVKSRSLVRVLAITQVLGFDILEMQRLAEWDTFLPLHTAEVISDSSYVHRRPYIEAAIAGQPMRFHGPLPHRDGSRREAQLRSWMDTAPTILPRVSDRAGQPSAQRGRG